jgi:hypothetical protein
MPTRVDSFPTPDIDEYLDGSVWEFEEGRDYSTAIEARRLQNNLRNRARILHGKGATCKVRAFEDENGRGFHFQALVMVSGPHWTDGRADV